jgi:hypothetical protein
MPFDPREVALLRQRPLPSMMMATCAGSEARACWLSLASALMNEFAGTAFRPPPPAQRRKPFRHRLDENRLLPRRSHRGDRQLGTGQLEISFR